MLRQSVASSIAKLVAHGTSPRAGGKASLRGLSVLRSFSPSSAPSVYRAARKGGAARPRRAAMQRAGTTRASQGEGEKAGPPARMQGAGEKKPGGEKARESNRPGAGEPLPPPAFSWSGPRRRGREARTAHDHHQQPRREGMAADRPAGEKAAKGPTGRAAQGAGAARWTRRAAFFSHTLEGLGTPRRVLRRGGPSAAQTRATRGRDLAAPRAPGKPRHRRAACGPLYRVAKGGGPRTARLRATSPRRGGRHHRHALKR